MADPDAAPGLIGFSDDSAVVPQPLAAVSHSETVNPDNEGAYDNAGTYFFETASAMTHVGGNPDEIQFVAFNPATLLNQNIANISSATLTFLVYTSDVADIGTFQLNEYSYTNPIQKLLLADKTDTDTFQTSDPNSAGL